MLNYKSKTALRTRSQSCGKVLEKNGRPLHQPTKKQFYQQPKTTPFATFLKPRQTVYTGLRLKKIKFKKSMAGTW